MWNRLIGVLLLAMVLAINTAHAAAPTWQVVRNSDCTAAGTATGVTNGVVDCCTAAGAGFCEQITNSGLLFTRWLTLATTSGSNVYTSPGGDAISATQLLRVMTPGNWLRAVCAPPVGVGYGVNIAFTTGTLQRTPKVVFYSGTGELANATSVASTVLNCIIYGY